MFSTFLLSGTRRCFRLSCRIHPFSKETYFHLLENGIRLQDLAARRTHCYWDFIASRSSQLTKQGNVCVYNNSCVCAGINISVYSHLYLYLAKYELILMPPNVSHYHIGFSSLLHLLTFKLPPQQPCSTIHHLFTLWLSSKIHVLDYQNWIFRNDLLMKVQCLYIFSFALLLEAPLIFKIVNYFPVFFNDSILFMVVLVEHWGLYFLL